MPPMPLHDCDSRFVAVLRVRCRRALAVRSNRSSSAGMTPSEVEALARRFDVDSSRPVEPPKLRLYTHTK
jgi:hypothetical protein